MTEDTQKMVEIVDKYASLFISHYKEVINKNYAQLYNKFPLNKGHNIDIAFLNNLKVVEIIFTASKSALMVETRRHSLTLGQDPNLDPSDVIKGDEDAHRTEVVSLLNLSDVLAHLVLYLPFEAQDDKIRQIAEALVERHYSIIAEDVSIFQEIRIHEHGQELVAEIEEIKKCLITKLWKPAIASTATAMEDAFIIRLKKEGKDIRVEERSGKSYYLPELNNIAYKDFNLISDKTHDRVKILNQLRRFGTHSKSGATLEEDAIFAFSAFRQAISELFK